MTEQEKDLLLKDLCARLPYGVKIPKSNVIYPMTGINIALGYVELAVSERILIEDVRPYLRPMSSMTEEERNEYLSIKMQETERVALVEVYRSEAISIIMDWLNAHHFDYRGLIPMGLALPTPKGMYK